MKTNRNEIAATPPPPLGPTAAEIDRLVDGELPATERRALLLAMERRPATWRTCALAFLEAQAVKQSLAAVAEESASGETGSACRSARPDASASRAVGPGVRAFASWAAVAAAVLVAFGVGTLTTLDAGPAASTTSSRRPVATDRQEGRVAADRAGGDAFTFFVEDAAGRRRRVATPLVDAAEFDERFGMTFPTRVTPAVIQAWEGRGFRVSTRRRYAPLYAEDGRPLVVPVEDVDLVPVKGVAL